jgi:hypothetical protein
VCVCVCVCVNVNAERKTDPGHTDAVLVRNTVSSSTSTAHRRVRKLHEEKKMKKKNRPATPGAHP